jgi:hypothetical protein
MAVLVFDRRRREPVQRGFDVCLVVRLCENSETKKYAEKSSDQRV